MIMQTTTYTNTNRLVGFFHPTLGKTYCVDCWGVPSSDEEQGIPLAEADDVRHLCFNGTPICYSDSTCADCGRPIFEEASAEQESRRSMDMVALVTLAALAFWAGAALVWLF